MVRLKPSIILVYGNRDSVPLGRWSLEDGSVKTTESLSITSSPSFFFIISKVAALRAGPGWEELLFPGWGDELRFSCVPCVFSVVCSFKYSVKLSSVCVLLLSVCVDLLQVPGFTALS